MQKQKSPYYLPTGNEFVAVPTLYSENAAIESINFLHMGSRGLIEIVGSKEKPLIKPYLIWNGRAIELSDLSWEREDFWIPRFTFSNERVQLRGKICAPVGERGFIYQLEVSNHSADVAEVEFGLYGTWLQAIHSINESKPIQGEKIGYYSSWNQSLALDFRTAMTMFSFGVLPSEIMNTTCWYQGDAISIAESTKEVLIFHPDEDLAYQLTQKMTLKPQETHEIAFYWGVGLEEVGALTSAKEMFRQGQQKMFARTSQWLQQRKLQSAAPELERLLNLNAFFNLFFATGKTLDTEELVLVTSRSPRYYVSAAYWDRDSLLWSFPSVLHLDPQYAREMLDYVFKRQIRNIGMHSRYIDGTLLEPGFELDELCAPVIALHRYLEETKDYDYLTEAYIQQGLKRILSLLETHRHPKTALYDTFLLPSDDVASEPYVTYDNVLVWKAFRCWADMETWTGNSAQSEFYLDQAAQVKKAIWEYCLMEYEGNTVFAWSTDLAGNFRFYDEPPGSLQLLTYYKFCDSDDLVYLNTINAIRSPHNKYAFTDCTFSEMGCEHANHPWVLSICNSLLSGRSQEAGNLLTRIELDGGIACESFDEHEGFCQTGEAFATCAGFLAYSIYEAFPGDMSAKKGGEEDVSTVSALDKLA